MDENVILIIAGAIAPFVIQVVKAVYKAATGQEMPGVAALNLTYIVALVFAFAGRLVSGQFIVPQGDLAEVAPLFVTQVGAVLATATVIYKSLLKPPS